MTSENLATEIARSSAESDPSTPARGFEEAGILSKAQRLAVAGTIAPFIRDTEPAMRQRRVALVDASGNVVRYTTLADVRRQVLARAHLEISVVAPSKHTRNLCERCGSLQAKGRRAKVCDRCVDFVPCEACSGKVARKTAYRLRKRGAPVQCAECRQPHCATCMRRCRVLRDGGRCAGCETAARAPKSTRGSGKRRHCVHGHDTFVVGRTAKGECIACQRRRKVAA